MPVRTGSTGEFISATPVGDADMAMIAGFKAAPAAAGGGGGGTATLVASTGKAGAMCCETTTDPIDTTGATFIVVNAAVNSQIGLTDNKGNTWTKLVSQGSNPIQNVFVSSAPPVVGAGHTFSTVGSNLSGLTVQAWSGTTGVPFRYSTNSSGSLANASITAPGATSGTLFITGLASAVSATATINGSFTVSTSQAGVGGASYGSHLAYKVSSGTEAPTWTLTSGSGANATFMIGIGILGSSGGPTAAEVAYPFAH
jgi:hypothetical protein